MRCKDGQLAIFFLNLLFFQDTSPKESSPPDDRDIGTSVYSGCIVSAVLMILTIIYTKCVFLHVCIHVWCIYFSCCLLCLLHSLHYIFLQIYALVAVISFVFIQVQMVHCYWNVPY